jgi:predicted permease
MLGASYVDWRHATGPFESMTSMVPGVADCDITEQNPVRLACAHVEQSFLPTLGVYPILGRNFSAEEDQPNAPRVGLLSYGLWKSRYGGDPSVLRKSISLDGHPVAIVGVLPANFEMPTLLAVDVLLPECLDETAQRTADPGAVLRTFARMKPGVTVGGAAAALQPLFEQALAKAPAQFRSEVHLSVRSLRDRQVQDAKLASWVLLGAVLALLLLACTNVANLLLARATNRHREMSVRSALGASRARLMGQALTESLLLGLLGGAAGCWIAYGLLRLFVSIAPEGVPRLTQASLDWRVFLFTLGISSVCGILFGLAPASRKPVPESLCGKDVRSSKRSLLRETLIASQIAVSLILLTGAGLLLRSLWNLQSVPLGLETQNVLIATISLGESRYPDASQQFEFFDQLMSRARAIPGASTVALSDTLPPHGAMRATIYAGIEVAGRPRFAEGTGGMVGWRAVTPDYFAALAIPLLRGRAFRAGDLLPSENPIILSDSLARELFPHEDALGKSMRFGLQGPWRTVVGIAADVKNNGPEEKADPEFYLPWKNEPIEDLRAARVIIRTPFRPDGAARLLRSDVADLDATLPVNIETMTQRVSKLAARPRFNAFLLSLFAAMGIAMAAIGIYGVVGFLVALTTREIGVRMALGATPGAILRMVLGNVARWTCAGALFGLAGSWFAAQLLSALLFQVKAHDPTLLGAALALQVIVAFVAAWIPARRAMRVDPMVALRYE